MGLFSRKKEKPPASIPAAQPIPKPPVPPAGRENSTPMTEEEAKILAQTLSLYLKGKNE